MEHFDRLNNAPLDLSILREINANFGKHVAQKIYTEDEKLLRSLLSDALDPPADAEQTARIVVANKDVSGAPLAAYRRFVGFSGGLIKVLQKKLSSEVMKRRGTPLSEFLSYIHEHADGFVSLSKSTQSIMEVLGKISDASVSLASHRLIQPGAELIRGTYRLPASYTSGLSDIAVIAFKEAVLDAAAAKSASLTIQQATNDLLDSFEARKSLRRVQELVPEQKIAPIQFEIRDGRIAVAKEKNEAEPEDQDNIGAAREELIRSGEKLLHNLRTSNCDRRLIEEVEYLQEQLAANENIVRVAIANLKCDESISVFRSELPDSLVASLTAYSRGIDMYAAQFPSWERFLENVARTQIDETDLEDTRERAKDIANAYEKKPELADPEVPRLLKYFAEMRIAPGKAAKRATFALIRTIGNLLSKTLSQAVDLISKTFDETKKEVSKPLGKALAYALLHLALSGAASISPVASKIHEMKWLHDVRTIIEAHLENMIKPK